MHFNINRHIPKGISTNKQKKDKYMKIYTKILRAVPQMSQIQRYFRLWRCLNAGADEKATRKAITKIIVETQWLQKSFHLNSRSDEKTQDPEETTPDLTIEQWEPRDLVEVSKQPKQNNPTRGDNTITTWCSKNKEK